MRVGVLFLLPLIMWESLNFAQATPSHAAPKLQLVAKCRYMLSDTVTPRSQFSTTGPNFIGLKFQREKGSSHNDISSAMGFTETGPNSYRFEVNSPKNEVFLLTLNQLDKSNRAYLSARFEDSLHNVIAEEISGQKREGQLLTVYALTVLRLENEKQYERERSIKVSGPLQETIYLDVYKDGSIAAWKFEPESRYRKEIDLSEGVFTFSLDYRLKFGLFDQRNAQLIVTAKVETRQ